MSFPCPLSICNGTTHLNYNCIPSVICTHPLSFSCYSDVLLMSFSHLQWIDTLRLQLHFIRNLYTTIILLMSFSRPSHALLISCSYAPISFSCPSYTLPMYSSCPSHVLIMSLGICNGLTHLDYNCIPSVIYTHPLFCSCPSLALLMSLLCPSHVLRYLQWINSLGLQLHSIPNIHTSIILLMSFSCPSHVLIMSFPCT